MTCPLCAHWKQEQPNCGHFLIDGIHAPSKYSTSAFVAVVELGELTAWHLAIENTRPEMSKGLIDQMAHKAGYSMWKASA